AVRGGELATVDDAGELCEPPPIGKTYRSGGLRVEPADSVEFAAKAIGGGGGMLPAVEENVVYPPPRPGQGQFGQQTSIRTDIASEDRGRGHRLTAENPEYGGGGVAGARDVPEAKGRARGVHTPDVAVDLASATTVRVDLDCPGVDEED